MLAGWKLSGCMNLPDKLREHEVAFAVVDLGELTWRQKIKTSDIKVLPVESAKIVQNAEGKTLCRAYLRALFPDVSDKAFEVGYDIAKKAAKKGWFGWSKAGIPPLLVFEHEDDNDDNERAIIVFVTSTSRKIFPGEKPKVPPVRGNAANPDEDPLLGAMMSIQTILQSQVVARNALVGAAGVAGVGSAGLTAYKVKQTWPF